MPAQRTIVPTGNNRSGNCDGNAGRFSLTTRRGFTALAGSTALATLGVFSASARNSNKKELVITRTSDGPGLKETVPQEWYDHSKKAREKAQRMKEEKLNKPGVVSVGVDLGEAAIGGLRRKTIGIGVEGDGSPAQIPEHVDGIPVKVRQNASPKYECYDGSYSSLRGGIAIDARNNGNADSSITCRAWDDGWKILTARHLLTDNYKPCGSINDADIHRNGSKIGTEYDNASEYDAVWLDVDDDHFMSSKIVDESEEIIGWVTKDGIDLHSSDGTTHHFRARVTCSEECTIGGYDQTVSEDCGTQESVVIYNGSSEDGDSGGIRYFKGDDDDDGDAWLTSIHSGTKNDIPFGSAGYAIKENTGISSFD